MKFRIKSKQSDKDFADESIFERINTFEGCEKSVREVYKLSDTKLVIVEKLKLSL